MLSDVSDLSGDHYGWVAAGIVAVLGAVATLWTTVRKTKTDDSTTALTHANTIIKGWERYAARQDERIKIFEDERSNRERSWWEESGKRESAWRAEAEKLWDAHRDTLAREERCQMRLEWLRSQLRERSIEIPEWPFREDAP